MTSELLPPTPYNLIYSPLTTQSNFISVIRNLSLSFDPSRSIRLPAWLQLDAVCASTRLVLPWAKPYRKGKEMWVRLKNIHYFRSISASILSYSSVQPRYYQSKYHIELLFLKGFYISKSNNKKTSLVSIFCPPLKEEYKPGQPNLSSSKHVPN